MRVKIETLQGPRLILIVMDGLGGRPVPELGFKTPLEVAETPHLNEMAGAGTVGRHYPISPGIAVGSGLAHLQLFNYSPEECPQRGVLEALGAGIKLKRGDVAARINFATCRDGIVIDRRAGRDGKHLDEIAAEIETALSENEFGAVIEVKHTTQHRGVLVIRGWKGEFGAEDTDPVQENRKPVVPAGKSDAEKLVRFIHEKAKEVAGKSEWNRKRKAEGIPEANCILLRGMGGFFEVEPFEKRNGLKNPAAIADNALYLGAAKFVGMETHWVKDEKKIETAIDLLNDHEFVFVHFKRTDNASHDGDWARKVREIERVDALLKPLLDLRNVAVAVTGDHATPCLLREHSGDAVPVLFWGKNVPADPVNRFCEKDAIRGWAGQLRGRDIMPMLINLAGRMKEVGK